MLRWNLIMKCDSKLYNYSLFSLLKLIVIDQSQRKVTKTVKSKKEFKTQEKYAKLETKVQM